jgi:hypothetical protein
VCVYVCVRSTHSLAESVSKQLYSPLPLIHLLPEANRVPAAGNVYQCPVYKTLSRQASIASSLVVHWDSRCHSCGRLDAGADDVTWRGVACVAWRGVACVRRVFYRPLVTPRTS